MKKQIILVLGLLIIGALPAQEKGSYINFNVGGGIHTLSYSLLNGTEKEQAGYTLNAGYSYFFTPNWGIHTGLGIQSFNSMSTLTYLSSSQDIDTDGQAYEFKANFTSYQEKQQAILIDIPLAIQYKYLINEKIGLLASIGAKIALPVKSSFKTSGGGLVTTGYYSQWNVELSDMPQHGFSTMTNTFSGNTSFKPAYMGIADLGGFFKLSQRLDLYVGGYVNYGLNNVLTPDSRLIFQPNGVYNGVFASSQTNNVTPISFGVKVGVYFHLGKHTTFDDNVKTDKSTASLQSKEQLNIDDSPKSTTVVTSKTVVEKEVVSQLIAKDTKQNTASNLSTPSVATGKPALVVPIPLSNGGGKSSVAQKGTSTGNTGRFNQVQPADSLKTTSTVNSKTVVVKEHTTIQTSKGTKQNTASNLSNPSVATGKPALVVPIPLSNGGGKSSVAQKGTSTGNTGRFNKVQSADSLKTTSSLSSKTVIVNEHTSIQTTNGTKQNIGSSFSNTSIPTVNSTLVVPISSLNDDEKNNTVQANSPTTQHGQSNQGQPTESLGITNSANPVYMASTGAIVKPAPKGISRFFKSIFSKSSNPNEKVNKELENNPYNQNGNLNQGQSSDSLGTTYSENSRNHAVIDGITYQVPKGKRKYIKNILSKSSGRKGKPNYTQPSDSFNPSGSINSGTRTDSLNINDQSHTGQQTDPFERAKQIASSMNQWFDFDSFEITNANNSHTKELSDILKANPNMLLVFVGYTCNIGTQVINIKLGMKRVDTVIQKFLDQGVPESQLIGESKGYDEPLVPNDTAENRAKNRRVEINVIKDN